MEKNPKDFFADLLHIIYRLQKDLPLSAAATGDGRAFVAIPNAEPAEDFSPQLMFHLMQYTDGNPEEMKGLVVSHHYILNIRSSCSLHGEKGEGQRCGIWNSNAPIAFLSANCFRVHEEAFPIFSLETLEIVGTSSHVNSISYSL